jgi:hypothetical protein
MIMAAISGFVALVSACPQLDPENAGKPELIIMSEGKQLRVLDIDPGAGIEVTVLHQVMGYVNASARSTSASVGLTPQGNRWLVTGVNAGGMGLITFNAGDAVGELRVFVRNRKKEEVYRNVIYADTVNYPYDAAIAYNASMYYGDDAGTLNLPPYPANQWASYQLIVNAGFHYEAPDGLSGRTMRNNNGRGMTYVHEDSPRETIARKVHNIPHIIQIPAANEPFLRKDVFAFTLHFENDGDMVGGYDDRQRLELKTMDVDDSGNSGIPNERKNIHRYSIGGGDTFTHRWKFKLPADFRVSSEYTHIHQIKPEGGDSGNPTFTLTGRKLRTGREVLQLIYRGPIRDNGDPSVNWYPAEVDLEPFKGEWVYAEETVTYDNPGSFHIKLVRIRDMRVLMEYLYSPEQYEEVDPFVMFRKGNSYIRPKFGVYRRVMHMTSFGLPNPEDPVTEFNAEHNAVTVLFADFEMDKLKR